MMIPYASLSEALDSATKGVQILKAGEVTVRKAEFAKHLWIVQGHAQYRLLGDFPETFGAEGDPTDADVAVLQNLESALCDYADLDEPCTYGGIFDRIDWVKLVKLLIKVAPLFLESEPE
jgi:hypothetical protein